MAEAQILGLGGLLDSAARRWPANIEFGGNPDSIAIASFNRGSELLDCFSANQSYCTAPKAAAHHPGTKADRMGAG